MINHSILRQKYEGDDVEGGEIIQTFSLPHESDVRTCVLIVQGRYFRGIEVDLENVLILKFAISQNVALNYHRMRGLYFLRRL